ncbi:hypothetical protein GCM10010495_64800 [Kitasatospora herbaricolor]|nr:hypothetical protein [Kitasatospora herbaricolor]MDQ0312650.1 hypothetical protein [Kitasatospora herbaricolor]GGV38540.1 hypothetical protein GCM10010495_64800 [Kitasatospora herbaricolor]
MLGASVVLLTVVLLDHSLRRTGSGPDPTPGTGSSTGSAPADRQDAVRP